MPHLILYMLSFHEVSVTLILIIVSLSGLPKMINHQTVKIFNDKLKDLRN